MNKLKKTTSRKIGDNDLLLYTHVRSEIKKMYNITTFYHFTSLI